MGRPPGALSLPSPLGGACMCGLVRPPVFCGSPRGDAAAVAPGESLLGRVGPTPTNAGAHSAAAVRWFSHGLLSTAPRGGTTALAVREEAAPGAALERPARGPATQQPPGWGGWHSGRTMHGARGALVRLMPNLGVGHEPLLPCGTRGTQRPLGGPSGPAGATRDHAGPPGPRPTGVSSGGGGAIRLAGQGTPCVPGAPGNGTPGGAPMRGASQDVGGFADPPAPRGIPCLRRLRPRRRSLAFLATSLRP